MKLIDLCEEWKKWSITADKSEDGWQSNYYGWSTLMSVAMATMSQASLTVEEFRALELCWAASEETEELAEFCREHVDRCWANLSLLARSPRPEVRWQVYDVLSSAGKKSEPLLKVGIEDNDPYVQRRAILSLARLQPEDARNIAERFIENVDPYIRQAALEMAFASGDADFITKARTKLIHDDDAHVRKAAARRLE